MTRDDIIRMAEDAGMTPISHVSTADLICTRESIERFAALVAAAEREKWEPVIAGVIREMPKRMRSDDRGNAPGHCHRIPGIWDDDNGDIAGTECAWCAAWNAAQEVIRARGEE